MIMDRENVKKTTGSWQEVYCIYHVMYGCS